MSDLGKIIFTLLLTFVILIALGSGDCIPQSDAEGRRIVVDGWERSVDNKERIDALEDRVKALERK